jgi:broad specificity polyphosphatase/5'/3'-nucleotidase SurE
MNYTSLPDYSRISNDATDTDIWAINAGYISISPLRFEPTHHDVIPAIKDCLREIEGEFRTDARYQ